MSRQWIKKGKEKKKRLQTNLWGVYLVWTISGNYTELIHSILFSALPYVWERPSKDDMIPSLREISIQLLNIFKAA